jgi:serine/threonine-protein kinase
MILLETLGAVQLRRDGAEVRSVLAQPRRLALLVYLATARPRGFKSRDRLLGMFWPDADPERARNSLRQALHQLRRSLGDGALLARGDREVGVDASVLRCDTVAFDEAIEAGRPEEALQLYRGDFLPGFFLEGAPEAERFIEDERARYRRAAVTAAWQLSTEEEARGDFRAATIHARQAIALDPHDEAGLRRTMDLLDRAGERAAALQLYEDFTRLLERELDLAPSPETVRQVERLRQPTAVTSAVFDAAPTPLASDEIPPEHERPAVDPRRSLRPSVRPWVLAAAGLLLLVAVGAYWTRHTAPAASPATDEVSSIAVLPFVNMSGDAANEYLSDGVSEELMHALSRVPRLNVVGHTSAFSFKGKDVSVDSIGRALRVGHVLEGSVRITGSRLRIVATLIDTHSGYHVWSDTYDADLDDAIDVQDRISRAIVAALKPRLAAAHLTEPDPLPETEDAEAYADVLRGFQAVRNGTPEDYTNARIYFSRAIARDSSYGRAHAGLAGVHMVEAMLGLMPLAEGYTLARATARRAIALDPTVPDAYAVLGRIAQDYEWDYAAADRYFRRAIELSPGSEAWHRLRARLLSILGRSDEAIALARRSTELDPLAPGAHRWLGLILYHARQHEAALASFDRALALAPDHPYGLAYKSYPFMGLGRYAEAVAVTERALAKAPDDQITLSAAAAANAAAGDTARAFALIAQLEESPRPSSYLLAEAVTHLGDRDRTFALLEAAAADRDPFLIEVSVTPAFDPLRSDPRMDHLMSRIGLR